MAQAANKSAQRIDSFLAMQSGRSDLWRDALTAAQHWASGHGSRAAVEASIGGSRHHRGVSRLSGRASHGPSAREDRGWRCRRRRRYDQAVLRCNSHRRLFDSRPRGAKPSDEGDVLQDVLPTVISGRDARRPYFEVLMVSPQPASRWPVIAAEMRRLRRVEDSFVYEPVIVGSFEDALCAAIVNPKILAVIVAEGVPFRSKHEAPVLRRILDDTIGQLPSRCFGAEARQYPEGRPARPGHLRHHRS